MESVPAEYLATYGSPYPVTPTIKDHIEHSIQFENVYAHAPNSHKSLISILTSSYPLISYKTLTKEMPDAEFASMSKRLKKLGYRTGFFYSADLRYAQIDQFLSHHTFDVIKDYRSIDCGVEFDSYGKEAFLKPGSASDWIRSGDQNPFFAIVWTNMTHIPYYTAIPDKLYTTEDSILNRYLNALYHGDQSLGLLLDSLREENLLASTLVVVTGDHGEAFGQHGQRGHGANLYEENIHVPLILINPLIGTGERREIVGGLVDIAPTVFQILGLPPSQFWQGSSLLNPNKPPRTYFFSTWTDLQFGYREKEQKYIFNATANKCESYNLTADPEETQGRLLVSDEKCLKIQERLAAWIQYQHSLTDKLSRALQ
jgi:arylsulfatase A-like enzyme